MKYPVITIGREFGSGGRKIGEALAKRLGIELYDKTIIDMVADKSGCSVDYVEENDQKLTRSMLFQIAVTGTLPPWINEESAPKAGGNLFDAQSEVIKDIAAKGGCVIVGRCADYILHDNPNRLAVFIRGDNEDKINRCVREYGLNPHSAVMDMMRRDKERADYYEHYTGSKWGSLENYDLCLNSSLLGIDGCIEIILNVIDYLTEK